MEPALTVQYRYYYNAAARLAKGKSRLLSPNYDYELKTTVLAQVYSFVQKSNL
jgi:hypothetical protein